MYTLIAFETNGSITMTQCDVNVDIEALTVNGYYLEDRFLFVKNYNHGIQFHKLNEHWTLIALNDYDNLMVFISNGNKENKVYKLENRRKLHHLTIQNVFMNMMIYPTEMSNRARLICLLALLGHKDINQGTFRYKDIIIKALNETEISFDTTVSHYKGKVDALRINTIKTMCNNR